MNCALLGRELLNLYHELAQPRPWRYEKTYLFIPPCTNIVNGGKVAARKIVTGYRRCSATLLKQLSKKCNILKEIVDISQDN